MERIDGEALGAAMILTIIGGTAVMIVAIVAVCSVVRSLRIAKLQYRLVEMLAERGASSADIESILRMTSAMWEGKETESEVFAGTSQRPPIINVPPAKPVAR